MNAFNYACRTSSEVHELVHIFVEASIDTEAAAFVEPVEIDVFLLLKVLVDSFEILLGYLYDDATCLEQEDLIDLISSLDDELPCFISFWSQKVNNFLDDVIVQVSEVWHVLHHPFAKVEINVFVFGNIVSKFLIYNWKIIFCLLESLFIQRRQRAIFIRCRSCRPLQIGQ